MTSVAGARPRILLDCDPGHDDAVAIVHAAPVSDHVGIVTVAGNAPLAATTRNAMVMRALVGLDVPVHSGAARPLVAPPRSASYVHGESGLDGADLPEPSTPLDGVDGVSFIVDTCRANEGLWLVPIGPLTNIALAIRQAPDLLDRIAGISLMGGGRFGNRTPAAEFNLWADPHAARTVFEAFDRVDHASDVGSPRLIMAGLHVTHQFQVTRARVAETRALPGVLAATLGDLFDFFSAAYRSNHIEGAMEGAALHDPLAVLAVTHPELFTAVERHVAVESDGEFTAGMTVIDERTLTDRRPANCSVLETVDADAAFALVVDAIRACA